MARYVGTDFCEMYMFGSFTRPPFTINLGYVSLPKITKEKLNLFIPFSPFPKPRKKPIIHPIKYYLFQQLRTCAYALI